MKRTKMSTDKVKALEDMACQFKRIGEDLLSILQENINETQKIEAVDKYFKTLLFTSTITEASSFLYDRDDDEDTQKASSIKVS
jgi:hypothetical protein